MGQTFPKFDTTCCQDGDQRCTEWTTADAEHTWGSPWCEENTPGTGQWVEVQSVLLRNDGGLESCRVNDDDPYAPQFGPHGTFSSSGGVPSLESLSYSPIRFDPSTTFDMERSHARYSNNVVHSTRARTQRRSEAWDDWLRAATVGRFVDLLGGLVEAPDEQFAGATRTPATYFIDQALTTISIRVHDEGNEAKHLSTSIPIDHIQVICPAMDFMLLEEQLNAQLDATDRGRAVLLEYMSEESSPLRRRICFLEATVSDRDHFVQALTSLWLEKRNDHSMWF